MVERVERSRRILYRYPYLCLCDPSPFHFQSHEGPKKPRQPVHLQLLPLPEANQRKPQV